MYFLIFYLHLVNIMLDVCVIGASGYTGAQLVELLLGHSEVQLKRVFVSAASADAGKAIGSLHGRLAASRLALEALDEGILATLAETMDIIFLATPHEASHQWMDQLSGGKARVLDLSGAFRLQDTRVFEQYYGFAHTSSQALSKAVYGLAEWYPQKIRNASVVAVPGCYPTASLCALKPLTAQNLLDPAHRPVINAVSGVSGAGRKAALTNSFCEVSLQSYGVLGHRHTPEIEAYCGVPVIFTPHLGNFKRGILATITVKLVSGVGAAMLQAAYEQAYQDHPLVRLRDSWPKLDDVVHTPFVDLHFKADPESGYAVITAAIDNVMKGAASQAIQCLNLMIGQPAAKGLIPL